MSIIIKKNFPFSFDTSSCSSCLGNCCIGQSGNIWINQQEMMNLSKYLNISVEELKIKFLRKELYKYSIKEIQLSKNNFACIFFDLDKKSCSIYEQRPQQCKTFPFWDYFKNNIKEVLKECPAITKL